MKKFIKIALEDPKAFIADWVGGTLLIAGFIVIYILLAHFLP